ncbi:hypothetical protein CORC01_09834 [Colletotrichum orchidophilum]|uniref:Uncharacterized protein n=1 Tax=Colletotrichum orchidophilum TaxID=1209926 RepID=A0A1G4B0Q3_9PEZI|nr:uncharacterized protein CORC01_09834 [Colletotrichum orchidophilum]OHE94915.1 hypothetical protein CORC01_09834 [Colletotrichum orchidophilum]
MSRPVFTAVFLSIFYLAKVAIYDLSVANGLMDSTQPDLLGEPITFTTLKPLDRLLTMLVRFFKPILDGKDPNLTLFSIFMAGQLLAVHVLIQVEGLRAGNRGRLVSCTTSWGMLSQLMTFGATLPLYFLTYLYTSPIPEAPTPDAFAAAVSIDPVQARAVIGSLTFGAFVPTLLAALPTPRVITPRTQEIFLAVWQAFPLWSGITQFVFAQLIGALGVVSKAAKSRTQTRINDVRRIYAYTLSVVVLTSYGVVGYVFWKSDWASEPAVEALTQMFRPTFPCSQAKMVTLERGILDLLQWDMYCASFATWSWIAYLAYESKGVGQAVIDLGKLVMWSAVAGPGGAALAVVWGRDVEALRSSGAKKKTG